MILILLYRNYSHVQLHAYRAEQYVYFALCIFKAIIK